MKDPESVNIAELKAKLSYYLRMVRSGHPLIVRDRETPIAKIMPHHESSSRLVIRKATRRPEDVILPPKPKNPTDSLAILLEDRNSGR